MELDYNNVLGKRNDTDVIINYVVCTMQLYSVPFPRARIKSHLSPDYWFKSLLLHFFVELLLMAAFITEIIEKLNVSHDMNFHFRMCVNYTPSSWLWLQFLTHIILTECSLEMNWRFEFKNCEVYFLFKPNFGFAHPSFHTLKGNCIMNIFCCGSSVSVWSFSWHLSYK